MKLTPETTAQQALSLVAQSKVTMEEYLKWDAERIERVKAEARTASSNGRLSVKHSPKGGVSLYGLQRFPVTFSVGQWERLFGVGRGLIEAYVAEHKAAIEAAVAHYATPAGKAKVDAEMAAKQAKRAA